MYMHTHCYYRLAVLGIGAHAAIYTSKSTIRLLARSALLPDNAMTMLGLAWRCSSFTHDFARTNVSCKQYNDVYRHITVYVSN